MVINVIYYYYLLSNWIASRSNK